MSSEPEPSTLRTQSCPSRFPMDSRWFAPNSRPPPTHGFPLKRLFTHARLTFADDPATATGMSSSSSVPVKPERSPTMDVWGRCAQSRALNPLTHRMSPLPETLPANVLKECQLTSASVAPSPFKTNAHLNSCGWFGCPIHMHCEMFVTVPPSSIVTVESAVLYFSTSSALDKSKTNVSPLRTTKSSAVATRRQLANATATKSHRIPFKNCVSVAVIRLYAVTCFVIGMDSV